MSFSKFVDEVYLLKPNIMFWDDLIRIDHSSRLLIFYSGSKTSFSSGKTVIKFDCEWLCLPIMQHPGEKPYFMYDVWN